MKKLITLLSLVLISIVVTAAPKPLTIDGKFTKTSVVTYELFVLGDDSNYSLVESKTVRKYFSVQVYSGATYLMRFTTEKGDSTITKYLLINPTNKGTFTVEVDFSTDDSAELYYHIAAGYMIRPYDPGVIKLPNHVAKR